MKNEAYYQAYLSHHHISRRGLLRHIFPATKSTIEKTQFRPPFSAREDLFSAVCNGCGKCASACPNGLIQLKQQQATLEINYAPCDLCGKCAEVCPTNALHLNFPADTLLRPQFSSACLIQKNQTCLDCQTACPQQAISSTLEIDNERCNGCGECKITCFVAAITLK